VIICRHTRLLAATEKAAGALRDPVIDHLYQSRTFKGFIVVLHLSLVAGLVFFIGLGGAAGWKNSGFYFMVALALPSIVPGVSICFCILILPWSKKLK